MVKFLSHVFDSLSYFCWIDQVALIVMFVVGCVRPHSVEKVSKAL